MNAGQEGAVPAGNMRANPSHVAETAHLTSAAAGADTDDPE